MQFMFICHFVGNDFIPHIPSLNIHMGGLDTLFDVYCNTYKKVDLKRLIRIKIRNQINKNKFHQVSMKC